MRRKIRRPMPPPPASQMPVRSRFGATAVFERLTHESLIAELGARQEVVTGHDFRGYSASIKYALISGLMAAGCKVHDIGLAVTPMAYFAQFALDVPCVAMVTASHNDNGWTGVKMGANRPLTFGPDEMTRLKEIVLGANFALAAGGGYAFVENFPARYIADLTRRPKLKRKLKVVAACGNGTAGAFAPAGDVDLPPDHQRGENGVVPAEQRLRGHRHAQRGAHVADDRRHDVAAPAPVAAPPPEGIE